jgi:hypothetical protein
MLYMVMLTPLLMIERGKRKEVQKMRWPPEKFVPGGSGVEAWHKSFSALPAAARTFCCPIILSRGCRPELLPSAESTFKSLLFHACRCQRRGFILRDSWRWHPQRASCAPPLADLKILRHEANIELDADITLAGKHNTRLL